MSLADELSKLIEMHKAGFLSEEELRAAKAQLLNLPAQQQAEGAAAPTATAQPSSSCDQQATPIDAAKAANALLVSPALTSDVEAAVGVLLTLLSNITSHPEEAKYRTVRGSNKRVARDVLSVAGAEEFLLSAGFAKEGDSFAFTGCAAGGGPPPPQRLAELGGVVAQLSRLVGAREIREKEVQRRAIRDEIRGETRAEHRADGSIISHCRSELMSNDDLGGIADHLKRLLQNVIKNPEEAKFRRVNVTPAFDEGCWRRFGSQEFLLDIAGWELEVAEQAAPTVHPALSLSLPGEKVGLQQQGLDFLLSVLEDHRLEREAEEREKREEARKQVRQLIDAHRAGARKQQRQAQGGHADPEAPAGAGSGKKVAMKDALRYLRGEEVPTLTEDPSGVPETVAPSVADKAASARREEDMTATSLINAIMGLIELNYEKTSSESLTNPWMKEGNRLRQKFQRDRDMQYLHGIKEEWEGKVTRRVPG